jgi:integrase
MAKPIQLEKVEHDKRATKDIPIFLDDKLYGNLVDIIDSLEWDYKSSFRAAFHKRDKALVALLILTGVRISEALRLKRKQFRIYKDYILLVNVETLKHGKLRKEIVLPKHGSLAPFTAIFEAWLNEIPEKEEEAYMFPVGTIKGFHLEQALTRYRANRIIKKTTGKFPHWFRAVCENLYGKKVFNNNAYKLKDFMGLVNLASTDPYVQADWTEDKAKVFKL